MWFNYKNSCLQKIINNCEMSAANFLSANGDSDRVGRKELCCVIESDLFQSDLQNECFWHTPIDKLHIPIGSRINWIRYSPHFALLHDVKREWIDE